MRTALAPFLLFLLLVAGVFLLFRFRAGPPPPPPPAPAPAALPVPPPPPRPRDPVEVRLFRFEGRLAVFARRTDFGLPAAEAGVALSGGGAVASEGRTDGNGVWVGHLPQGVTTVAVTWGGTTLTLPLPPAPVDGPADLIAIAGGPSLRPGDSFRILVLRPGGAPLPPLEALLSVEGASSRVELHLPENCFLLEETGTPGVNGSPRWWTEGTLPDDAPTGTATLLVGGLPALTLPVLPRFGSTARGDGAVRDPDAPPDPDARGVEGDLRREEGGWTFRPEGMEEGAAVLFLARDGGRLLGHVAVVPGRDGGGAPLHIPGGSRAVVRAVASTPAGFVEAEAPSTAGGEGPWLEVVDGRTSTPPSVTVHLRAAPGAADGPLPVATLAAAASVAGGGEALAGPEVEDAASILRLPLPREAAGRTLRVEAVAAGPGLPAPLRRTVLLPPLREAPPPPPRPIPVRPGDAPEAGGPHLLLPAETEEVALLLRPGRTGSFPGRGLALPEDGEVAWSVEAPREAAGPLRLRGDGAILLETAVRPATAGTAPSQGREGTVSAAGLAGAALALEGRVEGLLGLLLRATVPAPGPDAPAADGGIELERRMPARWRVGEVGEVVVLLRWRGAGTPVEVRLPLPGGTEPAEDGWEVGLRSGGPCAVLMPRQGREGWSHETRWILPDLEAGETRLSLRLRPLRRGSYTAPAASATVPTLDGAWGRSRSERITVE